MNVERRRELIEPEHPRLSILRQRALVSISRSSYCGRGTVETVENLALMRVIDEQFLTLSWTPPGTATDR